MPVVNIPAYVTITAQSYSENGHFLAAATDGGKVAIFSVVDIIEKTAKNDGVIFTFDANSCLEQSNQNGAINCMATIGDLLVVAMAFAKNSAILAFSWNDLKKQRAKILWTIEGKNHFVLKK